MKDMVHAWAVGVVLVASSSALATGETWRYPEPDVPATGPALVEIGTPGREAAPKIDVIIQDNDGKRLPAVPVRVVSFMGKQESKPLVAATDAEGRVIVRGLDTKGLDAIRMAFAWEAGIKVIRVRLEHGKKGSWEVVAAPYKRIVDGTDGGSCKNLFTLKPEAGGNYTLNFKRPPSLAWCEEIVYGSNKHESEIARISAIGARNVNKGDKNMYSADDEIKMGLEASSQFDQKMPGINDAEIVGYVTKVAEKVVAASDQPKMPVNVRVVNTPDVNAFVTAGGHIYVFTGLITMAQNESQVAGVLAHEISHAIARHVTEGATRNAKAQGGAQIGAAVLGGLLGVGENTQGLVTKAATTSAGLITLKYDRGSESEADLLGSQYLWKAGWDPEAIARFFELFQKASKGKSTPQFLSTHPSDEKRVENGIGWARAFLPAKERYLVNTAEFDACKAKVKKLPPPPKAPAPAGAGG